MAHREQHSNREAKKPKKEKPKGALEHSPTDGPSARRYRQKSIPSIRRRSLASPSGLCDSQRIDGDTPSKNRKLCAFRCRGERLEGSDVVRASDNDQDELRGWLPGFLGNRDGQAPHAPEELLFFEGVNVRSRWEMQGVGHC
jgi:hypothetical protein